MTLSNVEYINSISASDFNRLRKSVGWNELSARQAEIGLTNSSYVIAAVKNGSAIGMSRVISDGGYVVLIVDVIVLPEYQGMGIGQELMNRVMQFIRDGINEGEKVFVNLMAAKGKEPFYMKFGFTERPSEMHGAGMTQWISK